MSFITMQKTLADGEVPGVALSLAKNKINDALGKIYDETDWSFQTRNDGAWLCPGLVASTGTVTAVPGSNEIIGDTVASAAWAAISFPLITQLQFRNPAYSLYKIVAYDTTENAPFGTLTLDRPWMEPITGAGQPYLMYQAYFAVQVQDFRKFIAILDTTNNAPVVFWKKSQNDIAVEDPQRLIFGPSVPTYAVPYGTDQRPGSSTLGWLLYELWPHNLSYMPYTYSYKRRGATLVNPSDCVPYPLTDELVTWRTKEVLYQYKEAQKGEHMQRGAGADWRFLADAAHKEYVEVLKKIRAVDAYLHQDFVTRPIQNPAPSTDGYSTERLGLLNIGRW